MQVQEIEMDQDLDKFQQQLVRDTLDAVLASHRFEAAPQMSAFLRYVVEQAITGNHNRIKAFTVAVDALGKPDTFDPQNDPLVRVLAGRLRTALNAYNEEQPESALFITMNPGSYVPIFLKGDTGKATAAVKVKKTSTADPSEPAAPLSKTLVNNALADTTDTDTDTDTDTEQEIALDRGANTQDRQRQANRKIRTARGDHEPSLASSIQTRRMQILVIATILVLATSLIYFSNQPNSQTDSKNQSITSLQTSRSIESARARPNDPIVFVSAADHVTPLELSLNAVISSVISEDSNIKVHRYFDTENFTQFWPEDYMLNLTVLDLPDETRVDMQLLEAQNGRVVHTQVLTFSPTAEEQLTHEEMNKLINVTRSIVGETGPLLADYASFDTSR